MHLNRIPLLLVGLLVSCTLAPQADPEASQTPVAAKAPASPERGTASQTVPESARIATKPLNSAPIQITLADLPQPFATDSASKSPNVIDIPANPSLNVPAGFEVNVFAEGLERPRWLALTPTGEVLVTETPQNRITLLSDPNQDGVAEQKQQFATADNGLNQPLGMAFADNYFFLGNTNAVLRFPYQSGQIQLSGRGEQIAALPADGYNNHWTRNVVVSPDQQRLYVSIGSASNVDVEPAPRASVQVMDFNGQSSSFATGLRNPVGLDFHPVTGELYTTVNERDGLGDNLVPDYFTRIQQGEFYGWPYAYLSADRLDPRQVRGDQSINPELAARTQTPDLLFQAHSAALGLQFYDGQTFPERYRNGAFVAFRGSWNRNQGTGYKIVFVPFGSDNRPTGAYEDFVTGFLVDPAGPTTWGRPVGLLTLPDGSLLFTEEANGRIYRVQYRG
ncbi:MAG: sorbosone dehydrogenase family protein [Pegethrix bostrychoides GSE-TBD4-15B]|uniref:Sorbosone dehydrogenase family protein n=1 Tax=Pegethrix bostrychoides GSE-TBD4-15B TaxID=2839662 RepID=A0A951PB89_9CYAN|nr:sorbosone dehydrogenase family protein [Pegethrix bostrychoides GSE-TBD4-15B]